MSIRLLLATFGMLMVPAWPAARAPQSGGAPGATVQLPLTSSYASFLASDDRTEVGDIAVDASGNVYLAGYAGGNFATRAACVPTAAARPTHS